MDPTTPHTDSDASGADHYAPSAHAFGQSGALENTDPHELLRTGITVTLVDEAFTSDGVLSAGGQVGQHDRDAAEQLVFQLLTAERDLSDSDRDPDFRLLTEEVALGEDGLQGAGVNIPNRYDIIESIGQGGNGQVFSVFDNNLKREVATKFLHPHRAKKPASFARFVREAQLTASLAHPNILPIYDVDVSDSGLPYFTMRKADGLPLSDIITNSKRRGHPLREIGTWFDRAGIIMKVCDAVAYAHSVGVIHQDIKPDNIVLGRYGEVMLIDWGTAISREEIEAGAVKLQGTPAYMSPEQARREYVDEKSDIYCVGTSLFHLLTLRLPTWSDDVDSFWELKRKGSYQDCSREEAADIPAALLAIARQAMAPDPDDRYATIDEMRHDLHRFQAGLSVSAHSDSIADILRRFHRRNRAAIWVGLAGMALVLASIAFYAYEKSKEYSRWHTVLDEDFSGYAQADLIGDWEASYASSYRKAAKVIVDLKEQPFWTIEDGAIHFSNNGNSGCHNLSFRQAMPGNLRVAWDVTASKEAYDLNAFIAGSDRFEGYTFHVAGFGDRSRVECTRQTGSSRELVMDRVHLAQPITVGQTYRFRMEREGQHIRFFIDEKLIIDVTDRTPLIGSANHQFGFESNGSRLLIDNLLVQRQLLPEKVEAIAVADALYAEDRFDQAIHRYRGIIDSFPDSEMAHLAAYRIAVAMLGKAAALENDDQLEPDDRRHRIQTLLLGIQAQLTGFLLDHPDHELRHDARARLVDVLFRLDRDQRAIDLMDRIASDPDTPPSIARFVLQRFVAARRRALVHTDWEVQEVDQARQLLEDWKYWRSRLGESLPDLETVSSAMECLVRAGYAEEALANYGDQPIGAIAALSALGRHQEILDRFHSIDRAAINALAALERWDDLATVNPWHSRQIKHVIRSGDQEAWLARDDIPKWVRADLLTSLDRWDEVLALEPTNLDAKVFTGHGESITVTLKETFLDNPIGWGTESALIRLDRVEEIWPTLEEHFVWRRDTHQHAMLVMPLTLALKGEAERARELIIRADERPRRVDTLAFLNHILIPFTRHQMTGTMDALAQRWQDMAADPRFAYSAAPEMIGQILNGAPVDTTQITEPILSGIAAELRNDPAAAIANYRRYPVRFPSRHIPNDHFVRWRLLELTGTDPARP